MSVKRTKSSGNGFGINRTDGSLRGVRNTGKVFQSLLSDLDGLEVEKPVLPVVANPTRETLEKIAGLFDLYSEDEIKVAVKQTAEKLIISQFSEKTAKSKIAKEAQATISEFVAKDKFMSEKILSVLRRLKAQV